MENEKTNGYVFSFHREKYNWEEIKSFTHEECLEREENERFTEWEEFYNCVDCSDFAPMILNVITTTGSSRWMERNIMYI